MLAMACVCFFPADLHHLRWCPRAVSLSRPIHARVIHRMVASTPHLPRDRSSASMAQAMLDAHNAIRARVGVPPLVWSDQLAQVAQDWANHLIATGALSHRPNNRYGENIRTSTQYLAGTRRRPRLSIPGPRKHGDTTFAAIPAPASAVTIRRSSGPRPAPSAALSPPIDSERSGSATTIPQETSSGSDHTEQPR